MNLHLGNIVTKIPLIMEDKVEMKLIKNGKVIEKKEITGNTWKTAGLNYCRNVLVLSGGVNAPVNSINVYAAGNHFYSSTNSKPAVNTARFYCSIPADGAITGITRFDLWHDTTQYATIAVSSFDKPGTISLEITWDTTFSGLADRGHGVMRDAVVEGETASVDRMGVICTEYGAPNGYTVSTTNSSPSDTVARFVGIFPDTETLSNIGTIQIRGPGYADNPGVYGQQTVDWFTKPSGMKLEIIWNSDLS